MKPHKWWNKEIKQAIEERKARHLGIIEQPKSRDYMKKRCSSDGISTEKRAASELKQE